LLAATFRRFVPALALVRARSFLELSAHFIRVVRSNQYNRSDGLDWTNVQERCYPYSVADAQVQAACEETSSRTFNSR